MWNIWDAVIRELPHSSIADVIFMTFSRGNNKNRRADAYAGYAY